MLKQIYNFLITGNVLNTVVFGICFIIGLIIILRTVQKFKFSKEDGFVYEAKNGKKVLYDRRVNIQSKIDLIESHKLRDEIELLQDNFQNTQYRIMREYFEQLRHELVNIYKSFMAQYIKKELGGVENNAPCYRYELLVNDVIFEKILELFKRIKDNGVHKLVGTQWDKYKQVKINSFLRQKKEEIDKCWKEKEMLVNYELYYKEKQDEIESITKSILDNMENEIRQSQIDMHNVIDPKLKQIELLKALPKKREDKNEV